jgi:peroxiredoxin Q/BCP
MTTSAPDVGDTAPGFTLPTDGGETLSLSFPRDKAVVLYFYPKDSTPGCTTEAQGFRDRKDDFAARGVEIVGISKDSVKSHDNFKTKHELTFTLVSDIEGTCCEAYGVWVLKKNYGREYMGIERATFLIDKDGKIAQVWRKVRVKGHVDAVLDAVKDLDSQP